MDRFKVTPKNFDSKIKQLAQAIADRVEPGVQVTLSSGGFGRSEYILRIKSPNLYEEDFKMALWLEQDSKTDFRVKYIRIYGEGLTG